MTAASNVSRQLEMRTRPAGTPVMHHTWHDLLFVHWKVCPELAQSWLPPGLTIDTCEGAAWLGIVPFKMRNIRPVQLPAVPWLSDFLELNVRTYVLDQDGIPGVWFLSLDANRWLAVQGARRWFHLPYHWATIRSDRTPAGLIDYRCRRGNSRNGSESVFEWHPSGAPYSAEPGTLEFFLVERYVLFASVGKGRIARGRVCHPPYPLQFPRLSRWSEQPLRDNGISALGTPPDHAVSSPGVHVDVFGLEVVPA